MRKIKILFVTHHWKNNSHHSQFGGYHRMVDFISSKKIESTILTWGEKDEEYFDRNTKIIVKKIPRFMRFWFKRSILLKEASRISLDYDLVHALFDDVAPLDIDKPLISTIHTIKELDKDSLFLKLRWIYQKKVINKSKKIIVLSSNMKKLL